MSDAYSVKLPEEVQNKIKKLVQESGMTNKDFVTTLITNYELEQTKLKTDTISADITEIQQLSNRINNIFIGIGERINTLKENYNGELSEKNKLNQDTVQSLQKCIETLEKKLAEESKRIETFAGENEELKNKLEESQQNIKKLEDTISDKSALIEEYSQKNKILKTTVEQYVGMAEENKILTKETTGLRNGSQLLKEEIKHLKDISEQKKKLHNDELEKLKNSLHIEYERKILDLEKELRQKLDDNQNSYSLKISEYEEKVKELLEKLEKNKAKKVILSNRKAQKTNKD